MAELEQETEPENVGLDGARLDRIAQHFGRYVDDGRLAGWLAVVTRKGKVAYIARAGARNLQTQAPVGVDTLWRLYSMTKPVTSVAAMMLYEEGAFDLRDLVAQWIPAFSEPRVYVAGPPGAPFTRPAIEPIRVWHLLTHTAGLTYGLNETDVVDAMYRAAGFKWSWPESMDLASAVDTWAGLPLLFDPGTEWAYSQATDVVGRLIEIISGQTLDEFFRERILEPLGMRDTGFWVEDDEVERVAALYGPEAGTRRAVPFTALGSVARPTLLSGGAGLIATALDYHRFTQMLLNEGELDGVRLLGPRTVRFMTANHLPGGVDLEAFGRPLFAESSYAGVGFGLGMSVTLNPAMAKLIGSPGEYAWGGAASTAFWIDPAERLTAMFFTQLIPSSTHPIRPDLRRLVYSAIRD